MISADFYKFCKTGDLYNAKIFLENKNKIIIQDNYLQAACESENLELITLILNDDRIDCYYKIEELFYFLISNKKYDIIKFLFFKPFFKNHLKTLVRLFRSFDFITNEDNKEFIFSFIDTFLEHHYESNSFDSQLLFTKHFLFNKALPFFKYIIEHEKFINSNNEANFLYYCLHSIRKHKNPCLNEIDDVLDCLLNSNIIFKKADFEFFIFESELRLNDIINNNPYYKSDKLFHLNHIFNVFEKMYDFVDFKNHIANFLNNKEVRENSEKKYNPEMVIFQYYLKKLKPKVSQNINIEYNKKVIEKLNLF